MLGRYYLILIFGILAFFVFAGCVEFGVAQAPVDAIAVWQHQEGEDWDVWYSIWDHSAKKWYVPGGGEAEAIFVHEGNDHDPDVNSYSDTAIAVWSKEENNQRTVYFSKWQDNVWSIPDPISTAGKDTDPTVAMDEAQDAIAVWVHDGRELYYSVYSSTSRSWSTPQKINTSGISRVSLPELTYSEYWSAYFLVFTGIDENDGKQYSYEMFYWGGWHGPWWIDYDAVLDNSEPTDQRTGISADWYNGFVTYVWPVTDGTLESYSYKYDFATYTFNLYGENKMPDTAYDASDVAHGIQTKNDDLYHQPNVNSPTTENLVSNLPTEDLRGSLTFILNRTVGLTVWWNKEDGSGEIYYAYNDGSWSTPVPIVSIHLNGYDRNPAVTPIQKIAVEEEPLPFCGDGVLQGGEQCEVGIPCPNPNEICWIDCMCYPFEYPYCGDGVLDPGEQCEAGIPCPNPNDICWIDCKCYTGKRPPPQPPPQPPPEEPPEQPPPEEPPEEEEEEPELTTSCKGNSAEIGRLGINIFDPSRYVCVADCDEGYVCDAHSCNCLPATAVITPRCGDGYISTPEVPGGGREECDTGSASNPKPDTCPYPEVCIGCKCVGPGDSVSCYVNTRSVDRTDVNKFDNDSMICTDDCSLSYGESYECVLSSCTCRLKQPEPECTSDSDCASGYVCEDGVCVLEEEEPPEPEPVCGNGVLESGEQCEAGIPCPEGYFCEGCMCYGYEVIQECGNGVREGTEECDGSDMGECSEGAVCSEGCTCVYPPELDCEDVCGEMGLPTILGHGYENADVCTLAAQEPEEECWTKCILAGFYRVDNIAGWDSCCCKKKEMFPCEGCPGPEPYCPECPEEYQD
jgi:hypothetical protein